MARLYTSSPRVRRLLLLSVLLHIKYWRFGFSFGPDLFTALLGMPCACCFLSSTMHRGSCVAVSLLLPWVHQGGLHPLERNSPVIT